MEAIHIVKDILPRDYTKNPMSPGEKKATGFFRLEDSVRTEAMVQKVGEYLTSDATDPLYSQETIDQMWEKKLHIDKTPYALQTKELRDQAKDIATIITTEEKRNRIMHSYGGVLVTILRARVDADLQEELDVFVKQYEGNFMRAFHGIMALWREQYVGLPHLILQEIRELISMVGYATTPTQLAKVIRQLKNLHDMTQSWLLDGKGHPRDAENPPVSDTEWKRELAKRCGGQGLFKYNLAAQEAVLTSATFDEICAKLVKMQIEAVPTMDVLQKEAELSRQHLPHPAHPVHVAFEEADVEDREQRAYQLGLDEAAALAQEECQPSFYAGGGLPQSQPQFQPQFQRAPFGAWRGGRSTYPRGPGRGPYWSPPNPYRQGQQNQRPGLSTHANQHAEFTAQAKDGDPPLAKVMCAHWDGARCHSGDPNCGLGHPPGVCAPGGGGKSST